MSPTSTFAVGIQLKIMVGLAVLFLSSYMMSDAAGFIFNEVKKITVSFVGGMM